MADDLSFIPTRGACLRDHAKDTFKTVVYESYKRKPRKQHDVSGSTVVTPPPPHQAELDMKKVRFEVFKFGMSAHNFKTKGKLETNLAVQLGAKPGKKQGQNYKELMRIRKQQAENSKKQKMFHAIGKVKGISTDMGKKWMYNNKRREKVKKISILEPYGKPGEAIVKKRKH